MLRDVVKLGVVTAVGLGVVATVGVGVGVATLVAGVIFAGVSSAEPPENGTTGAPNGGSTPKVEERKLPKQAKQASQPEKRPTSDTTKKQISKARTDIESKSDPLPDSKMPAPNGREERKAPTPASTNVQSKSDRALESKDPATNERMAPTPAPNRQRSASVLVNKPGGAPAPSSAAKDVVPSNGSSNVTALPGDKPISLSRELEAQITPEVREWRSERSPNQEPKKRAAAPGRGGIEKRSSPALQAKAEAVFVPEPSTGVNAPGPLPLLPPAPISKPKSKPQLSEAIVESQSKPEVTPASVAEPVKETATPTQNGVPQEGPSLSKPGDRPPVPLVRSKIDIALPLQAVPVQDSQPRISISNTQDSEARRYLDVAPLASAPVEESAVLTADVLLVATASSLEAKPLNASSLLTGTENGVVPNRSGVLQGPASASRDSLASVQRRNSKLTSAAKKVSHSVKKVFKGPDGKVIHSDPQRFTSSSSDSVDSQQVTADPGQTLLNGRAISNLASSSRESVASTKSRRSLINGTKKSLKRMFKPSSDNIEVPPVPPLPSLTPSIANEKPAVVPSESTSSAPKPTKGISPKNASGSQQPHGSDPSPAQNVRNAGGAEAGNNASPLLKGMFKGRTATRVRR